MMYNPKGVYWDKSANKWRAQITWLGKKKHLGYYDNIQDAALAYTQKEDLYMELEGKIGMDRLLKSGILDNKEL